MALLFPQLNFNSVENVPGFEARAAFSTSLPANQNESLHESRP